MTRPTLPSPHSQYPSRSPGPGRSLTALLLCVLAAPVLATVDSVYVQSRLDYNAILISGVDVVFLYDQEAIDALPQTKSDWESGKQAYLQRMGDSVDLVSVFIPQGFDSEMMSLPERRDEALRVVVFAQHDSSTRAPIDISERDNVLIEIDQFGILVSSRD